MKCISQIINEPQPQRDDHDCAQTHSSKKKPPPTFELVEQQLNPLTVMNAINTMMHQPK